MTVEVGRCCPCSFAHVDLPFFLHSSVHTFLTLLQSVACVFGSITSIIWNWNNNNAYIIWGIVSIQMFVGSVYQIVHLLTQLSFIQGPCLPLLSLRPLSLPLPPLLCHHYTLLSSFGIFWRGSTPIIRVLGMASIDLGLWVITQICHPLFVLT